MTLLAFAYKFFGLAATDFLGAIAEKEHATGSPFGLTSATFRDLLHTIGVTHDVDMHVDEPHAEIVPTVALTAATLAKLSLPFEALYSTLGRILARGIEARLMVDRMAGWHDRLLANIEAGNVSTFNVTKWERSSWPAHARGIGTIEAPRGALGHWIIIDDGKITKSGSGAHHLECRPDGRGRPARPV